MIAPENLMSLSRITAVFFLLVSLAGSASAATYFVSPTGNDANAGTVSAPFATINKAASVVKPGDVVEVRGGVYYDRASIYSKGTASAPIVFRSYPGEKAILDGRDVPSNKGVVQLIETEYVDFSGFEVRNAPYIGIVLWYARNTRVLDNEVHHTTRNGIYAGADAIGQSSDITVSGNFVHDTVLENQYHNMGSEGWAGAVVVSKTDRATITNNRIWNNDGEGLISLRGNSHLVQGNEIADNFSMNLYIDNARFVTADRNLIYTTGNTRYYRNGTPAIGIGIANETNTNMNPSSDNLIMNNIVIGNRWGFYYGAFESGGGLRNTRVVNNTFYGSTDTIVRIEDDAHSNSVIENNIFYQTGSPTPKYAGGGLVTFRNNLWYGGSAGPATGAGDIIGDPLFVNAGGFRADDYRLTSLSLAVHKGVDRSDVPSDFWGNTRTATYDIGAHEYSLPLGSSSPITPEPPAAPANLSATALSSSSITLAWTASTSANVSYRISRNGAQVATISGTSWTDQGLAASTTYAYSVVAVDQDGRVSTATTASATTQAGVVVDTQAPSIPTDFWATPSTSSARIHLGWNPATDNVGVTGYKIFRNGAHVATITATTWTDDSGLAYATTYQYGVIAVDAAGNASAQATTSATTRANPTTADTQAPTVPEGFWVTPSSSSTRMYLAWKPSTDNVGVAGYKVYRNGAHVTTVTGTDWTDDSGLPPGTTFVYGVSAFDAAGNESVQATFTAKTTSKKTLKRRGANH